MRLLMILFIFPSLCFADDWTSNDTYREAAYLSALAIDCKQTLYGVHHPEKYEETNPLLPKHPSVGRVNVTCVTVALSHIAIARFLSSEYRYRFQVASIALELWAVNSNYMAGIKWGF